MANTGFKGISVRQTGGKIVFRSSLKDSSGAVVTSGTTTLQLLELQDDGTVKSYDFTSNTFKSSGMTSGGQTVSMTHRTGLTYSGGDASFNTGVWTYSLSTVSGFVVGGMYIAITTNSGASPTSQEREFQYGSTEGDVSIGAASGGVAVLNSAPTSGSMTNSTFGATLYQAISQMRMYSSVVTSPLTAGIFYANGSYLNGEAVYQNITNSCYVWWTGSAWVLTPVLGTIPSNYWQSSGDESGPWAAVGSPTGIPVMKVRGVPSSGKTYMNATIDSSGRFDLGSILGTGLTETVTGYLAAGFKKLFDVVSPIFTLASANQSGDAYSRLGSPTGATVSADLAAINSKTTNLPASPAAVGSQMNLVNSPNSTAITAIQSGLATTSDVNSVKTQTDKLTFDVSNNVKSTPQTSVVVGTNGDKTGYSLDASYDASKTAAQAIDIPSASTISAAVWNYATTSMTTVGSIGKKLADWVVGTLADNAITANKFDRSTAHPVTSADSGATRIARTGADGDTLETLSDQIDPIGGLLTRKVNVIVGARTTSGNAATIKIQLLEYGGELVDLSDVDPAATCTLSVIRDGSDIPQFELSTDDMGEPNSHGWFEAEFENPNFETDVGYTAIASITADGQSYENRIDNFEVWP